MILQKIRLREPVILMGETGTGKTYLVKYIAEVLFGSRSCFRPFIFHFGVEECVFVEFMEQVIDEAVSTPSRVFWVFFDEFNTSDLQAHIAELLIDRKFSLSSNSNGIT